MSNEQAFRITGMDCASCARTVEAGVAKLDGVQNCELNFTTELLRVQGPVAPETIVGRIRELGYDVATRSAPETIPSANFFQFMWQRLEMRLALLAFLLVLPGLLFHELLSGLNLHHPLLDISAVVAMVLAGYPVAFSAWRAVSVNREVNINVLMTLAAIGAVIIGAYTEAGVVMVLFVLGEALEGFTAERARGSIRSLVAVVPNEATRLTYTGEEIHEENVPVAALRVGDHIVVKPGQRIPMDGRVVAGASTVNQAPITGESRLIDKQVHDQVFASSINGEGSLEIEITHLAQDNTISRLIAMVEEAQGRRAPAQRFVDQFARIYTPAVVALAVLVATVPPLFLGQPFLNPDASTTGWLYRALALLVVACPCALVISTPVSIVSAISNGARHGVLFKGGAYVEALSRVKAMAFDKTGTLTKGQPVVVQVRAIDCQEDVEVGCDQCDELLALASAVEQRSEHPIAQAIVDQAARQGVKQDYAAADGVTALTGRGVTGWVDGRQVTVGSHAYFEDNIPHAPHCAEVDRIDAGGYTTMLVSSERDYKGYIAVADAVRQSSREALAALKDLGIDNLVMLTGDNEMTAQRVAAQVGITAVRANCLPEDKVTAVTELRRQHEHVAMIGDGINDAPALATASVGVAIGHTAQAMETADISLMGESLQALPFAIKLSRATMRTIRANVVFSIGVKLLFLLLVLAGMGSMWLAVLADMGTSLLVTLNGMRLLRRG